MTLILQATEEEFAKITDEVDTIKERKTEMEDKYSKACQYLGKLAYDVLSESCHFHE